MTVSKFAIMSRPGIRSDPRITKLKLRRLALIFKARRLKRAGKTTLAARAEAAICEITSLLMREGAFR